MTIPISRVEIRQNTLKPGKKLKSAEIWYDDSGPCPEPPKKSPCFGYGTSPFFGLQSLSCSVKESLSYCPTANPKVMEKPNFES